MKFCQILFVFLILNSRISAQSDALGQANSKEQTQEQGTKQVQSSEPSEPGSKGEDKSLINEEGAHVESNGTKTEQHGKFDPKETAFHHISGFSTPVVQTG